ncbi:putative regulatory protein [Botrytis fragariae]|uniref:Putative regulatory protein n=1 Tax=Botrytis fragariae TaxID=1964551 RepID=A0A8H6B0L6_9HELO|nr:putative regulatory protein [Botrytis fragariae]KAF5876912.1 putative regulatory protein [Botrytis fragariae]
MLAARSSTGCWTCRLRKKKCQEERPKCSTCDSLRITCHGYSEKPTWMDGGSSEKAESERIKRVIKENKKRKREIVSLAVAKNGPGSTPITDSSMTDTESSDASRKPSCVSCSLNLVINDYHGREANLLMHYLDIVFPRQFRFYRPLASEGGRGWLLSILLRTRPLYHAALSLSAYHQSATYTGIGSKASDNILEDLQKHHCLALVGLRQHIDRLSLEIGLGRTKTKVEILACMICLISFEALKGDSDDWQTHLQAARTIFMGLKDNFLLPLTISNAARVIEGSPNPDSDALSLDEELALEFFSTALIWFDGISSVTTGANSEYSNIYPSILRMDNGRIQLCKLMGSQNWVMIAIMDIALLAEWKITREGLGDLSQSQLARRAACIEDRLENGIQENRVRQTGDNYDQCGIRAQESQHVTHIFACAAKVYLYVTQSGAYPRIPEIRDSVSAALKAFRDLPDGRWICHLVWPFCIVSCMADEEHQNKFREIAALVNKERDIFCNFQNAFSIMEECWRLRESQPCSPWSWVTAMSSLGVKTLLV